MTHCTIRIAGMAKTFPATQTNMITHHRQQPTKNMEHQNYVTITIPKGKKVNFKMLTKVYGSVQTYDYSNPEVAATCRVYLSWGIN